MKLLKVWHIFSESERNWLKWMVFMLLVSSMLELIGLALVIPYVNIMISEQYLASFSQSWPLFNSVLPFSGDYRIDATVFFGCFYLFKNSLLGFITFHTHSIQKRLQANLENKMFQVTLEQQYKNFITKNSSDEIRKITYDTVNFGEAILSHSAIILTELVLFFGVITILAFHQIEALVVVLFISSLLAIIFVFLKQRLVAWGRLLQTKEATVIKIIQEGIGGFKDAQVLGVKGFFQTAFYNNVISKSRIKRNRDVAVLIPRFVIETLIMLTLAMIMFWLGRSGGLEENLSSIAFLAVVVVRMLPMSNRVMNSIGVIRTQIPSIEIVSNSLRANNLKDDSDDRIKPIIRDSFLSINIKNLTFSYACNQVLLRNISLDINHGEIIGIIGRSGAGKSTLVDIILGLLRPQSGKVLINKLTDINSDLQTWQKKIGYVQQNVFLLDDTIVNNIAFGIPEHEIKMEQVKRVSELSKLINWIETLPEGFGTKVGERGLSISGGQRQRIGIARAMYHDPELLILDEATSSLDNRTELKFMDDVYSMKNERTIIIIAHKLSTIKKCDKVVLLDNGIIAGLDTYENLQAKNKIFQDLSIQSKG